MRGVVVGVLLVACGGGESQTIDAPPQRMPDAGRLQSCTAIPIRVSCIGGVASVRIHNYPIASPTHCTLPDVVTTYQCATGCIVEGYDRPWGNNPGAASFVGKEAHLCNERVATAGSACTFDGNECRSSRATIAADGTVAGHDYLACVDDTCQATTPPPTWEATKTACDSMTKAMFGPNVNGAYVQYTKFGVCLLAWDASTTAVTSAESKFCLLDSQCPAGALCDNLIPALANETVLAPFGVCKPGPRGVLTPQMLVP